MYVTIIHCNLYLYTGYGFVPISSINNSNQMYDEVSHVKANENDNYKVGL